MGILSSLLSQSFDRSPSSDFWYMPIGGISKAGVQIDEQTALRISAVLQGVRFISQTVAGLPRFMFRHLEDGRSRVKDTNHPLNEILRYQPNSWQTSFQFFESMIANAMLHGIAVAERRDSRDGTLEALMQINPRRIGDIEITSSGMLVFVVREDDGRARRVRQDETFYLSGFGIEGPKGLALIRQMREVAGLQIALEDYGSTFFANSAMPRVVLENQHAVTPEVRARMKASWNEAFSGDRQHSTALLEDGTKVTVLSTKNDEAQFLESKRFNIAEFSRILDVTPHRLSDMEKSSYNNVEQMSLETVVYSLTPWVQRLEQSIRRDLISADDKAAGYFFEFIMEGLLRGDTSARSEFYSKGINAGWLTRNEVREKENMNPEEGLDAPLQPQNMVPVGEPMPQPTPKPTNGQAPEDDDDEIMDESAPMNGRSSRAKALALAAAERIVRRERMAMDKWRERASDWRDHAHAFYSGHVDFVAGALAIDKERAQRWCNARLLDICSGKSIPDKEAVAQLAMEALQ